MNNIIWNIQHLNGAVAGNRKFCKNKKYFNTNSVNGLFLIVYTMALIFPTHSSTLEKESNNLTCSDSMTCTKCIIKPECVWSLEQQECKIKNQINPLNLTVSKIGECPQYSVVTEYTNNTNPNYVMNILSITNDLVGFNKYLLSTIITYGTLNGYEKKAIIFNETITFSFRRQKLTSGVKIPTVTSFIYIKFNGTMLRFDNVSDHYFTFYEQEECATNDMYKSCATCGWNNNGYSNYLRWCSSDNPCKVSKNVYMRNNATHQLNENVAHVTNDCAEINVMAVEPLSGPNTGGTTVIIMVRNHRIFMENRTLKVTVAGKVCTNPRTSGLEAITCTTSQAVGALSGPVLVEYSSTKGVLKIESSQIFQFCLNPVLDPDQRLDGVKSGGTSVPVRGSHFVEHCIVSPAIRLYVDLPNGARWYSDGYCDPPVNDTYMVCQSPRVYWEEGVAIVGRPLHYGLDIISQQTVVYDKSPSFYVHPDPLLLDFEITLNGSVVVNGLNMQQVRPGEIVIRSVNSSSTVCEVLSVTQHSWVCKPNKSLNASQVISVTLGKILKYTVIRKKSPHPEDSPILLGWFLVIMSTVLAFVCAFAFCLKRKHRINVKESIRKSPGACIKSQPYTRCNLIL